MAEYASGEAAAALARAAELGATVRRSSKWFVWYQVVFGCATGMQMLAAGLLKAPYGASFGGVILGSALAALGVYAGRRPVVRQGYGRRMATMMGAWGLLYGAVFIPGLICFQGVATWWVPGAVAVSLPGLIGGYLEARR
ncbi:hypothetical protein ACH4VR_35250 [Streptomyces sp. NPDC020883]|uniref:hypothetical protein n=1 Tax=Streptomyces sp. NPDC020883 TaxID=3365099 RepID=UPI00379847F1